MLFSGATARLRKLDYIATGDFPHTTKLGMPPKDAP